MLEQVPQSPEREAVHLQLQNRPLAALLAHLLREWGYPLTSQPQKQDLRLYENTKKERLVLQTGENQQLSSHRLPLNLPQLFQALGSRLQEEKTDYQMRISINQPLIVKVRGEEFRSETRSLSDRGLRFSLERELVRGEQLELQLLLGERKYHLMAEVLYVLPGKELGWGERVDIGVCFKPLARSTRQYILDWILGCYLQRLQLLMDNKDLQTALKLIQLPQGSLGMLNKSRC